MVERRTLRCRRLGRWRWWRTSSGRWKRRRRARRRRGGEAVRRGAALFCTVSIVPEKFPRLGILCFQIGNGATQQKNVNCGKCAKIATFCLLFGFHVLIQSTDKSITEIKTLPVT